MKNSPKHSCEIYFIRDKFPFIPFHSCTNDMISVRPFFEIFFEIVSATKSRKKNRKRLISPELFQWWVYIFFERDLSFSLVFLATLFRVLSFWLNKVVAAAAVAVAAVSFSSTTMRTQFCWSKKFYLWTKKETRKKNLMKWTLRSVELNIVRRLVSLLFFSIPGKSNRGDERFMYFSIHWIHIYFHFFFSLCLLCVCVNELICSGRCPIRSQWTKFL